MEDDAPAAAALPVDLVLEIAARSDPATLLRCAAACRALRLGAASPVFHRGLRLRHAGGEGGRFVPALLRGFFHQRRRRAEGEDPRFVDPLLPRGAPSPEPFRSFLSEYTDLFEFYAPAAARGGLVALRSSNPDEEEEPSVVTTCTSMGVCDPMAGSLEFFRPPGISAHSHVLLSHGCDGIGCRFRLVAANLQSPQADDRAACCCLQTQAYSSDTGAWGPITETWVPGLPRGAEFVRPAALVLDGVAHWLCMSSDHQSYCVLTFSSKASPTVTVTVIREEDDGDDHCRRLHGRKPEELLLVSSPVEGRVSLLVAEQGLEISLWTADAAGSCWTRQVMVDTEKVRQAAAPMELPLDGKRELRWFGEKSGGVLRVVEPVRGCSLYFMLGMGTGRVRMLCRFCRDRDVLVFFPYEMDLSFWRPKITPNVIVHR
ncbi:unnamed protein product [Urochloa decumbens]|uniref:DUF7595 domain-containing protein n=1 Tax=Urochloa decumbens TaxID=240449 RepID=A0ABC8W830_9POAL